MAIYVKTESGVVPLFPDIDKNIEDWNSAVTSGFYHSEAGAANGPVTDVPLAGNIITSGNLVIQQVYPEDTSKEELVYYLRKGFVANSAVTWTKWFITNLYLEEYIEPEPYNLTPIMVSSNPTGGLYYLIDRYSVKSIYFTDIKMPSNATSIDTDVDEDGDGGVVAWLDASDNTKMYISTQYKGVKVQIQDAMYMFKNNSNVIYIDMSNLDIINSKFFNYMFYGTKITEIDLSGWNTINATSFNSLFSNCTALKNIIGISNLDTHNLTSMESMFTLCKSLQELDLSNWNTSKVTNMDYMFGACTDLTTIKVRDKFKWIATLDKLGLSGTWQDETGKQYTSNDTFPTGAHTYTKVS